MEKLNNFTNILNSKPFIKSLINNLNADVYLVGGATRDLILNKLNKDIDLLIRKVPIDLLISDLQKFGKVDVVGKSFGVIKFIDQDGVDYDIALPRMEKPTGEGGYKGFEIQSDENLPIDVDLSRRDARFNAMGIHLNTGAFIDPLGGLKDIENKQISAANPEAFSDDPLRMIRIVAQACRFNFTIEPNTMKMIIDNSTRIKEISTERLLTEFDKIIKKGNIRIGVQLLKDTKLFENIFGFELKQSVIDRSPFEEVHTMGEFLYLMIRLLSNPSEFYLKRFSTDDAKRDKIYKDIRALEVGFNYHGNSPIEARSIAHNIYIINPNTIESLIFPEVVGVACQELLSGKYPKIVNELAVNGNELMQLGLKGKEIGDTQKSLLINIYGDKIKNTSEDILLFLGKNIEEGVGDRYLSNKNILPNPDDKFNSEYNAEVQKNMENAYGFIYAKKFVDDRQLSKIPVFKNPKSLYNFDSNVRAIGDSSGNLYVALFDGYFNHGKMANDIGLTNNNIGIFQNDNIKKYVLMHRVKNQKYFALSDSSYDLLYNYSDEIVNILWKVQKINPQYEFYNMRYDNIPSYAKPVNSDNLTENLNDANILIKKIEDNQETIQTNMNESLQDDLKAFRASKEIQNQLKPTNLPKDEKGNFIMKDIEYSAIVLNERSTNKLLELFKDKIPNGWTPYAHHMSVCRGQLPVDQQQNTGLTYQLTVESIAFDDNVIALGVTGYPSNNNHPHITLAVNRANGGKPVMSNYLTNWEKTPRIKVSGVLTEIPYKIRTNE